MKMRPILKAVTWNKVIFNPDLTYMLCKGQLIYEECPWFESFLEIVAALFVDCVLFTKRKRHAQTEMPL